VRYLTRIDQADKTGYLQSRCCFFLMNIHTTPRTIYFARVSSILVTPFELSLMKV
jgi:6-phosphofructo-2-kinase/fructose-2,6-biphosphatase 4